MSLHFMPGLVPGIDVFKTIHKQERRGWLDVLASDAVLQTAMPAVTRKDGNTRAMLTEAKTYDELYRNFRWDIPARFNMATACCDRYADGSGRLALLYVDESGAITRTSFDEVAEASRRFANVLKADGLVRGDRVAVFLSQSLELPVAHMAAFRSGLVSIPLFALFGEDALEFRLSNSGAKAIVTDEAG
jgi:acetyl-CoA synthetase